MTDARWSTQVSYQLHTLSEAARQEEVDVISSWCEDEDDWGSSSSYPGGFSEGFSGSTHSLTLGEMVRGCF